MRKRKHNQLSWFSGWNNGLLNLFSDHLLCSQLCTKHRQYQEEWGVLPAQMSGYELNCKTDTGISFSKLGFLNRRATRTKCQIIWVTVGTLRLLMFLADTWENQKYIKKMGIGLHLRGEGGIWNQVSWHCKASDGQAPGALSWTSLWHWATCSSGWEPSE